MKYFKHLTRKALFFFISLLLFSCANDSIPDEEVSIAADTDLSTLFDDYLSQNHELEIKHDVLDENKIQELIYGDNSPFNSSEEISPNNTSKKNSRNETLSLDYLKEFTNQSFLSYMVRFHKYYGRVGGDTPKWRNQLKETYDIPESLGETTYFTNGEITTHNNVNTPSSMVFISAARPIKWIITFNNDQAKYSGFSFSESYLLADYFVLPANDISFTQLNDKSKRVYGLNKHGGGNINIKTYVYYW